MVTRKEKSSTNQRCRVKSDAPGYPMLPKEGTPEFYVGPLSRFPITGYRRRKKTIRRVSQKDLLAMMKVAEGVIAMILARPILQVRSKKRRKRRVKGRAEQPRRSVATIVRHES